MRPARSAGSSAKGQAKPQGETVRTPPHSHVPNCSGCDLTRKRVQRRLTRGADRVVRGIGSGLASLDENGALADDCEGKSTERSDASLLSLGNFTARRRDDANPMSGCYTARGEIDSLRHYCPPERKSKNVLFTPR